MFLANNVFGCSSIVLSEERHCESQTNQVTSRFYFGKQLPRENRLWYYTRSQVLGGPHGFDQIGILLILASHT